MQIVPVQPIPNQTLQVILNNQACVLNIYQLDYGLFMDVYVGVKLITCGVICQNLNRIVRYAYLGFVGDLVWDDTQGAGNPQDPVYTGLGSRFILIYVDPADIAANGG
jgi:hypothetical protein